MYVVFAGLPGYFLLPTHRHAGGLRPSLIDSTPAGLLLAAALLKLTSRQGRSCNDASECSGRTEGRTNDPTAGSSSSRGSDRSAMISVWLHPASAASSPAKTRRDYERGVREVDSRGHSIFTDSPSTFHRWVACRTRCTLLRPRLHGGPSLRREALPSYRWIGGSLDLDLSLFSKRCCTSYDFILRVIPNGGQWMTTAAATSLYSECATTNIIQLRGLRAAGTERIFSGSSCRSRQCTAEETPSQSQSASIATLTLTLNSHKTRMSYFVFFKFCGTQQVARRLLRIPDP